MDAAQIVEVISECAGSSWMFKNRAPHVVDGDYTPHSSVNIWLKDLGIVQQIAKSSGVETPLTESALRQFIAAADAGLGTQDDAAVTKIYARQANVKLRESDARRALINRKIRSTTNDSIFRKPRFSVARVATN